MRKRPCRRPELVPYHRWRPMGAACLKGTRVLDLAITGGTVITMDGERRVLPGGAVGVRDGAIVVVEADPAALDPARETIDAGGHIVLPGIVDTHGHAGHSLTRGLGEGLDEGGWSDIVETIYFHASDIGFWEAESRLAALERLRFGVTTSVSMTGSSPRIDDARYAVAASVGVVAAVPSTMAQSTPVG